MTWRTKSLRLCICRLSGALQYDITYISSPHTARFDADLTLPSPLIGHVYASSRPQWVPAQARPFGRITSVYYTWIPVSESGCTGFASYGKMSSSRWSSGARCVCPSMCGRIPCLPPPAASHFSPLDGKRHVSGGPQGSSLPYTHTVLS
jgi:hypothetical protein